MPGSSATDSVSTSRSSFTFWHCSHSCRITAKLWSGATQGHLLSAKPSASAPTLLTALVVVVTPCTMQAWWLLAEIVSSEAFLPACLSQSSMNPGAVFGRQGSR